MQIRIIARDTCMYSKVYSLCLLRNDGENKTEYIGHGT